MKLLLKKEKSFFLFTKVLQLPITKNIFKFIIRASPTTTNELTLNIMFEVAWTSLMKMEELTYIVAEKAITFFKNLHLIRSNIIFSKPNQYATLNFKYNQTNINYTGVFIMLAITKYFTSPVTVLRSLFIYNSQLLHTFLFIFNYFSFSC